LKSIIGIDENSENSIMGMVIGYGVWAILQIYLGVLKGTSIVDNIEVKKN